MLRAIIVDDETAVGILITHFIKEERLPIEIVGLAEDGVQALEMIAELKPDLVFLDIRMPGLDGLEVMSRAPDYRYIIITAYESFHYAQQALRLGACDILLKPIDNTQLAEAVSRAVGDNFTESPLANQALSFINSHYFQAIDISDLADRLNVSASHLARTFKKYVGHSLVTYINRRRIEAAKSHLAEDSMTVKEIAARVGYESPNNFFRYFKLYVEMTPAAYRRLHGRWKSRDRG